MASLGLARETMGDVIAIDIPGAPVPMRWETDLQKELVHLTQEVIIKKFLRVKAAFNKAKDRDAIDLAFRLKRELEILNHFITERQRLIDLTYQQEQERRLAKWRGEDGI